jgi:hypothetical protein
MTRRSVRALWPLALLLSLLALRAAGCRKAEKPPEKTPAAHPHWITPLMTPPPPRPTPTMWPGVTRVPALPE